MLKKLTNRTRSLAQNKFIQSSVLLTVTANLANFINFLVNFFLVKFLSVPNYGEYSSALAYSVFFSIPLSILSLIIIQKVGQKSPVDRKGYFMILEKRIFAWFNQIKFWLIFIFALGGFLIWQWSNLLYISSTFFIIIFTILAFLGSIYSAFLQGEKNFRAYSLISILGTAIKLGGVLLIVNFWPNLINAYLVLIISSVATFLVQRKVAFDSASSTTTFSTTSTTITSAASIFSTASHVEPLSLAKLCRQKAVWLPTLTMLGVMALTSLDLILVKKLMTPEDAGLYGVISLFARTIGYALNPIAQVVFAFGASVEESQNHERNLLWSLFFFIACGLIATVCYALMPKFLITVVAKNSYFSIAHILWFAGIFGTLYAIALLLAQFFINNYRLVAISSLIFAGLQVVGIYLFHNSFTQILAVDIMASLGLVTTYLIFFILIKKGLVEKAKKYRLRID